MSNQQRQDGRNQKQQGGQANEGEGNKTAARNYNEDLQRDIKKGHVEEQAQEAKRALDGKEGDELKRAEEEGRSHAREVEEDRSYNKQSKLKE